MKVSDLRKLVDSFKDAIASSHSTFLAKQKLGFTFHQVYNKQPLIIQAIVAEAILKANEPLLESDKIRLPTWISQNTFASFISKMNQVCQ